MKEIIGVIGGKSGRAISKKLNEKGFLTALVGGKNQDPGMEIANFKLVTDLKNINEIIKFFKEKNVKKIIIGTGHLKAIELVAALEKESFLLSIESDKSLFAKDKILFKESLLERGIKTPPFYKFKELPTLEHLKSIIQLPCVVKSSTDAIAPVKINSLDDLQDALKEVVKTNTEILIEKYIEGSDCTVAVINDGLEIKVLGIAYWSKAKENKLKGFENSYAIKINDEIEIQTLEVAKKIVKEFNIIGLVRVDFIVEKEIYVLELNSVVVTAPEGTNYPFFKEKGIELDEVMVDNALRIFRNKEVGFQS